MRVTSKGQVTIPIQFREKAGLTPNTEVDFGFERGKVFIQKHPPKPKRGEKLLAHLRGKGNVHMTTDQIMALTRGE